MSDNSKINVLVVDDESGALESFRMILEIKDYQVFAFSRGAEALEAAKTNRFDIAFVDLRMPEMDGLAVLENLKKIACNTEVIIVTAYASEESQANAISLGAMEYLRKPFLMEEIFSLCDRALRIKREKDLKNGKKTGGSASTLNIH